MRSNLISRVMCGVLAILSLQSASLGQDSKKAKARKTMRAEKSLHEAGVVEGAIWRFELKRGDTSHIGWYRVTDLHIFQALPETEAANYRTAEMNQDIAVSEPVPGKGQTKVQFKTLRAFNNGVPRDFEGTALLNRVSFTEAKGTFVANGIRYEMKAARVRE